MRKRSRHNVNLQITILNQGNISPEFTEFIGGLSKYTGKYSIYLSTSQEHGIEANRNRIVRDFLKTDGDFLIMIDDDNPPSKDFIDLVELDKDVLILPTPIHLGDLQIGTSIKPNIWREYNGKRVQAISFSTGLEEIDSGGTGCIMVARRVLEATRHPFQGIYDEDGVRTRGQDIEFCRRVHEAGFKIWTHWDYPCHHFKTIDLLDL